jgi:hypothetical protein
MTIEIEYDGSYPNLCSGTLVAVIDGTRWTFPPYCMSSGGGVWFDDDWGDHTDEGPWGISRWPEDFPEDKKQAVLDAVNDKVRPGCCGGCI